jgi:UDP-3-O-[3-hydroxymyristoyl] N-acetylglucosamine deacetylase
VHDGDKWARFTPYDGFRLDFTIDFPHPVFGSENRNVVVDFASDSYAKEVARARTFGFMQDVEAMRARAWGSAAACRTPSCSTSSRSSTARACATTTSSCATRCSTRSATCTLLGNPLIGQYTAYKSGHALNNKLCRALLARADAFEIATFTDEKTVPAAFHGWMLQPA